MPSIRSFAVIALACSTVLLAHQRPTLAQTTNPSPTTRPADVPVKSVVLYSSGVGYFEHYGTVRGDGSTELRFKTEQINDILKSLILQDMDGGKVSAITYPSQDPIAKTLKSFQVDITNNPPMADLLNQLRGAKVTVKQSDQTLTGTILGVEQKQVAAGKDNAPVMKPSLNLLVGLGTIKSVPIDMISDLTLDDPELQAELGKALVALASARDQDKKPVQIAFNGTGDRRVRLGYVVETPVWKTSYRLILSANEKEKAALQGWAIVENQTDNDWNNVQLSLVSGRPISFVEDLYQPLYIPRPVVTPERYASLRPQEYDGAMSKAKDGRAFRQKAAAQLEALAASSTPMSPAAKPNGESLERGEQTSDSAMNSPIDAGSSIASIASASKIGELFEYTVGNVSLPRQKSAMLPIITDPIEIERVSIYNESVLPRNPLNGARLKNTTTKHLLAGPITVLDANAYAGDAQIDNLPPGQERLLSYGVDLQMLVDAKSNQTNASVVAGKIVNGVLIVQRKYLMDREYTADNKSEKVKTLIVEHPKHDGWKLVDTVAPEETTDKVYRFKDTVEPGKSIKLAVRESNVRDEQFAILNSDPGLLEFFQKSGEIPQAARDVLVNAAAMRTAIADLQRQVNDHDAATQVITAEQNRIRENMKTVDRQSQYYNRLMAKLNDQESQLEKISNERDDLKKKLDQAQKELNTFVANTNVG